MVWKTVFLCLGSMENWKEKKNTKGNKVIFSSKKPTQIMKLRKIMKKTQSLQPFSSTSPSSIEVHECIEQKNGIMFGQIG